jgi:hypothetical protein
MWSRFVGASAVAEVPVASLGAGRYELRLTLTDASGERVVKAPFVIAK